VNLERVRLVSNKSFDDVLAGIYTGIGRPNIAELTAALAQAPTFEDFTRLVKDAVGGSDLLEFLRLDLHLALEKNPRMTAYKLVRIIAGNPLTMSQMTNYLPDAGSYAPVTILCTSGMTVCTWLTTLSAALFRTTTVTTRQRPQRTSTPRCSSS
jgi:hypothetical protein